MEELKKLIHQGCISNQLVPVFCGSAFKNKGVQPLLDGVVRLFLPLADASLQLLPFSQCGQVVMHGSKRAALTALQPCSMHVQGVRADADDRRSTTCPTPWRCLQ